MSDPKCRYNLLDVISDPNIKKNRNILHSIWTYERNHEIYVGLIFAGPMGKLYFQGVRSIEQIKKITNIAFKGPKEDIQKFQEMGHKLGISKKDFYLTLWGISDK